MKKNRESVVGMAAALALGLLAVTIDTTAAPPNSKTAQISCKPGWRGGAAGTYGGVAFDVTCNNGKGSTKINDPVGSAYSFRMGVETDTFAGDCAFSGDSNNVNETCVEVRLTIH